MQSEMKSFSEVVKSKCVSSAISPAKIKKAVHSAIREEDRAKNFIVFGAVEELECEEVEMTDLDSLVHDIFILRYHKVQRWPLIGNRSD